jgi:transposase-like protein
MRFYPSRNMLVTELFISDVLNYSDRKPMFAVDGAMADESPRRAWATIRC